jgi:hypothetical protein
MRAPDARSLCIADAGHVVTLDYAGALAAHAGESRFGVAVGFRMLQTAGEVLSRSGLWDRNELFVLSDHPGAGVRDVIEYVTRCVTQGRYVVYNDSARAHCGRDARFAWEIGDGMLVARVRLREEFVPRELLDLSDRIGSPRQRAGDAGRLKELKWRLAEQIWQPALEQLFSVHVVDAEASRRA